MIKTQKLNLGDLVAVTDNVGKISIGMIVEFDEAYTTYKIEWYNHSHIWTKASWITVQEYRNIFLDKRAQLL
jgi:hypothetical protein